MRSTGLEFPVESVESHERSDGAEALAIAGELLKGCGRGASHGGSIDWGFRSDEMERGRRDPERCPSEAQGEGDESDH